MASLRRETACRFKRRHPVSPPARSLSDRPRQFLSTNKRPADRPTHLAFPTHRFIYGQADLEVRFSWVSFGRPAVLSRVLLIVEPDCNWKEEKNSSWPEGRNQKPFGEGIVYVVVPTVVSSRGQAGIATTCDTNGEQQRKPKLRHALCRPGGQGGMATS